MTDVRGFWGLVNVSLLVTAVIFELTVLRMVWLTRKGDYYGANESGLSPEGWKAISRFAVLTQADRERIASQLGQEAKHRNEEAVKNWAETRRRMQSMSVFGGIFPGLILSGAWWLNERVVGFPLLLMVTVSVLIIGLAIWTAYAGLTLPKEPTPLGGKS